ncbi:RNA-directed DNA polymerase, eukaryota, reverse transcriptase zinc-binding domain protein [Tanacetum coccineum]
MNECRLYFLKFKAEEGMQFVLENGPWLVDGKPFFVQKWEAGICMVKPEPAKVPLWVRIINMPLEAWNVEGISRLASMIGNPIIMDRITTSMCEKSYGRASFARVLIKVDAEKGLVDNVEVCYESLGKSMELRVEYPWKPPICSHCKVFGHGYDRRNVRNDELNGGFIGGRNYIGESSTRGGFGMRVKKNSEVKSDKDKVTKQVNRGKSKMDVDVEVNGTSGVGNNICSKNMLYELSNEAQIEEKLNWDTVKARIDDIFANSLYVSNEEKDNWPHDLKDYYKKKCQDMAHNMDIGELKLKITNLEKQTSYSNKNVVMDSNKKTYSRCKGLIDEIGMTRNQAHEKAYNEAYRDEMERIKGLVLKKHLAEVDLFFATGQVLTIYEVDTWTDEMIDSYKAKVGVEAFENMNVVSNGMDRDLNQIQDLSAPIPALGWDTNVVSTQLLFQRGQRDLLEHKVIASNSPWVMLGDFNVILKINENTNRVNVRSEGMKEFIECVKELEMEDINMIMGNSHFIASFPTGFAEFMPYLSSDHCLAVLAVPEVAVKRPKSFRRLKAVKKHLRNLNKMNGNVFDKVEFLKVELARVQQSLDKNPSCSILREEEMMYVQSYKDVVFDAEKMFLKKTKIEWLKDGDSNSVFFHNVVKGRISKKNIHVVYDDLGNAYYGDDVPIQFLDVEKAVELIKHVTDEEIKDVLFSIDVNKVSGPNGYTLKFFKAAWSVVGNDTCSAIKEFFVSGKLLSELNTTLISLIPKNKTPAKVTDYRPISCCNVVYKGISKIITNRLKLVLGDLIDVRNWAFKIDIQKAYDTVSWKFLEFSLKEFGFHPVMMHWIMVCLTTVSFSVYVNGESHGFFKAKRGLRHGDPISPYLFTIVMEMLNLMVKRQVRNDNRFVYHSGCKKLKITSLFFVDDLLMLCHGDMVSASILRRGLDEFSLASGLYPSMSESEVFYCNIPTEVKEEIRLVMPFNEGVLPIRYLGVPLVPKRINKQDCKVLLEVLQSKINDWKNKSLSFAGRLQLIAFVLSSMQVYWGGNITGKVSVKWDDACKPKNQGGLGLKSMFEWNTTLMAKHLWNILTNKDSIWVRWVNVHKIKGRNLWEIECNRGMSWSWKHLLELRDKIRAFVRIKIGNGKGCSIWYDKWHPNGPLSKLINNGMIDQAGLNLKASVSDLINNNKWCWPQEWNSRFDEVLNVLVPSIDNSKEDKTIWCNKKGKERNFSATEVWKAIINDSPKVIWYRHVWYSQCIPRHTFITWIAIKGRLKTKDRLKTMAAMDNMSDDWACLVSEMANKPARNTIWSVIQRLVFGDVVYYLWQERNIRRADQKDRTVNSLFQVIMENVRYNISCKWVGDKVEGIDHVFFSNQNGSLVCSVQSAAGMDLHFFGCHDDSEYTAFPASCVSPFGFVLYVDFVIVIELGICPMPMLVYGQS